MSKSSFIDFRAVKAAITMEQVLEHYGLLSKFKRSGDSLSGPCPIHKGNNPTQFRVSVSKNIWNCFSECKHGGNTLDFIAKMENVTIHAAATMAVEWFHLNPDDLASDSRQEAEEEHQESKFADASRLQSRLTPKPETKPSEDKAAPAQDEYAPNKPLQFRLDKLEKDHPYLTERGLTPETIADFGIGFCAKGMMAGRIAIPIHTIGGDIVAYAGRWPGEPSGDNPKYKLPPGFRKAQELFNIHRAIKESGPLFIVEGFFGCLHLHQMGCRRVVALMGSSMSAFQEDIIRRNTDQNSQIIVMLDEDEAGWTGREDIAIRLAKLAFVKIHVFAKYGQQPDNLSAEEIMGFAA